MIFCGTIRRDASRRRLPRVSRRRPGWPPPHYSHEGSALTRQVTRHRALWCSDFPPSPSLFGESDSPPFQNREKYTPRAPRWQDGLGSAPAWSPRSPHRSTPNPGVRRTKALGRRGNTVSGNSIAAFGGRRTNAAALCRSGTPSRLPGGTAANGPLFRHRQIHVWRIVEHPSAVAAGDQLLFALAGHQ